MRKPSAGWIAFLKTLSILVFDVLVIVFIIKVTGLSNKISTQSNQSCIIQSRGLSAQPHLVRAMEDLATLVSPPKGVKIPPREAKAFAQFNDLSHQLDVYVGIEHKQPKSRVCKEN